MTSRLAISNIAWTPEEEPQVAVELERLAVSYVEIAPTKIFADPACVSDAELAAYLSFWAGHGIEVVAFQSMLFGRLDLTLFEDAPVRRHTVQRLGSFIELAGRMGARALVFGSPRNRQVPAGQTEADVWPIAIDAFSELGEAAAAAGTVLCIEPNPPQYACNFVTTAAAGARLVRDVAHPGFRLHLDAAGMTLAGDDVGDAITENADILAHYHVSAPELGEIESDVVDHRAAFAALRAIHYGGITSIEMRPGGEGEAARRVRDAVQLVRDLSG